MNPTIPTRTRILILLAALAGGAFAADPPARGKTQPPPKTAAPITVPEAPPAPPPPTARAVTYGAKDVVPVRTRVRYTTLIILPPNEKILDFTCGDKEFWVVNGNENLAYVKPAKENAETNLNLITASGNIYSFLLKELSDKPSEQVDLKVFIELREDAMADAAVSEPRFASSDEIKNYRQQVDLAKEETRQVKQAAQAAIDEGINKFISNVRFPYRFEAGKKPFNVRGMYHDEKFTYIQARPEETPALYEIKDGSPNLVNFDYENGVYVVRKVLDRGYLAIGKQKLAFSSEQ